MIRPLPKHRNSKNSKENDHVNDLVYYFHDVTINFGKIFEYTNLNLSTISNAWTKAEERE